MKKMIVVVMVLVSVLMAGNVFAGDFFKGADEAYQLTFTNSGKERILIVRYVNYPAEDLLSFGKGKRGIIARIAGAKAKGFYLKGVTTETALSLSMIEKDQTKDGEPYTIKRSLKINRYTGAGEYKLIFSGLDPVSLKWLNDRSDKDKDFTCKKVTRKF